MTGPRVRKKGDAQQTAPSPELAGGWVRCPVEQSGKKKRPPSGGVISLQRMELPLRGKEQQKKKPKKRAVSFESGKNAGAHRQTKVHFPRT